MKKEIKKVELVLNGVYKTHTKDLIQIKRLDKKNKEMDLYNMTEQCNLYKINTDKHILVTRIR